MIKDPSAAEALLTHALLALAPALLGLCCFLVYLIVTA